MVSKNKILGKYSLILVSIGSTKFPFFRLTSCLKGFNKDQYKIFDDFISPNQVINLIKKAEKIIIHCGPGTIYLAVKYAKFMPIIVPRLAKYREHVDNHQLFFCKYLKDKLPNNLKKYFVIDKKIDDVIGNYLKEKNKINNLNKYLFLNKNKDKLIRNLKNYILYKQPTSLRSGFQIK